MAKSKIVRSMKRAGESQLFTEEHHSSKFEDARPKKESPSKPTSQGRNYPLVGFTVSPEDKIAIGELTLYLSVKKGHTVSKSVLQRELIRIGKKYKDEIGEGVEVE